MNSLCHRTLLTRKEIFLSSEIQWYAVNSYQYNTIITTLETALTKILLEKWCSRYFIDEQRLSKTPTILTDFRAPYFKEWDQLSKIHSINK